MYFKLGLLKILLFFCVFAISPIFVSAYSANTTHPALTKETVKLFNQSYSNKALSNKERDVLMEGSINEDAGTRPLQHFYDPIHNRGLVLGPKEFQAAIHWAQDTFAQAKYTLNTASVPGSNVLQGSVKDLYSAETDYSWERAIYEYTWRDKERGLKTLGHILHLIQDASVPDHTRNDPHPPAFELGSPYEAWTAQFSPQNFTLDTGKQPIVFQDLKIYFEDIAIYSNTNFFSKDTVFSNNYLKPNFDFTNKEKLSDGKNYQFGYKSFGGENFKLVRITNNEELFRNKKPEFFIEDHDNLILSDYWNLLSEQAVLHGAGVIRLFFERVEEERETKELYEKNKSWLDTVSEAVKEGMTTIENALGLGGSQEKQGAQAVTTLRQQTDPDSSEDDEDTQELLAESVETTETSTETDVGNRTDQTDLDTRSETEEEDNAQQSEEEQNEAPQTEDSETSDNNSGTETGPGVQVLGGGGSDPEPASQNEDTQENTATEDGETQNDTEPPNPPSITTPTASSTIFTSADITFGGISEATSTIFAEYVKDGSSVTASTTASTTGVWSLPLSLDEGTTTVSIFAKDAAGNTSKTATRTLFIDSQGPKVSLSADTCHAQSLSTGKCLLATTSTALSWQSTSRDLAFFEIRFNSNRSTTTATSTTYAGLTENTHSFSVIGIDIYGNRGATSTINFSVNTAPVIFNEIAWMGTATSSSDEWIELYNKSEADIDLSGWHLYAKDGAPDITLQGVIKAGEYYLIERTSDETVRDVAADLVTPFSGEGHSSGLSNGGEELILSRGSTTIDRVPLCRGDWCGGDNRRHLTMERLSPDKDIWTSALGKYIENGHDAGGNAIHGTPKARNSQNYVVRVNTENTTLTKDRSPYLITQQVTVSAPQKLIIEPGVVIKVAPDIGSATSLLVRGSIKARGTAAEPIVFTAFADDVYGGDLNGDGMCEPNNASSTAECPTPGLAKKIYIENAADEAAFEHAIFRFGAGSRNVFDASLFIENSVAKFQNITVENASGNALRSLGATTTIKNSIIRNAEDIGIYISGGAGYVSDTLSTNNKRGMRITSSNHSLIKDNTFINNKRVAVEIVSSLPTLKNNSGNGNGKNAIVAFNSFLQRGEKGTMYPNQIPYLLHKSIQTAASSTLSIAPGTVIKGETGNDKARLTIRGTLILEGTQPDDIIFTSENDDTVGGQITTATTTPKAGDWMGISVLSGDIKGGGFTVRYAGHTGFGFVGPAFVFKDSNGTTTITDAVFENNFHRGFAANNAGTVIFKNSFFRNHTKEKTGSSLALFLLNTDVQLINTLFENNDLDIVATGSDVICENCTASSTEPADLIP